MALTRKQVLVTLLERARTIVGLVGIGLVVGGVWGLVGWQWGIITAGVPVATFYIYGEIRSVRGGAYDREG